MYEVIEFVLVIKEIRRYLRLAGQELGEAFIIFNIISYKEKGFSIVFSHRLIVYHCYRQKQDRY